MDQSTSATEGQHRQVRNILYVQSFPEMFTAEHYSVEKVRPHYRGAFYQSPFDGPRVSHADHRRGRYGANTVSVMGLVRDIGDNLDLLVVDGIFLEPITGHPSLSVSDLRSASRANILVMPLFSADDLDLHDADYGVECPIDDDGLIAVYDTIFTGKPQPQKDVDMTGPRVDVFGTLTGRPFFHFTPARYEMQNDLLVPKRS